MFCRPSVQSRILSFNDVQRRQSRKVGKSESRKVGESERRRRRAGSIVKLAKLLVIEHQPSMVITKRAFLIAARSLKHRIDVMGTVVPGRPDHRLVRIQPIRIPKVATNRPTHEWQATGQPSRCQHQHKSCGPCVPLVVAVVVLALLTATTVLIWNWVSPLLGPATKRAALGLVGLAE